MPVLLQILNRNTFYTEFYFEMQKAILPKSIGHESHGSICRKGQNLAPCKFRDDFSANYIKLNIEELATILSSSHI